MASRKNFEFNSRGKRNSDYSRNDNSRRFDNKKQKFDNSNDHTNGTRRGVSNHRNDRYSFSKIIRSLEDMEKDDYNYNITLKLLEPSMNIDQFLNDVTYEDRTVIILILKVITKASSIALMKTNFKRLLLLIMESKFTTMTLNEFITREMTELSDTNAIMLILVFIKSLFVNIPKKAYKLFYHKTKNIVILYENSQKEINETSLTILKIIEDLKILVKLDQPYDDKKFYLCCELSPPDDFRSISIYPTTEDLLKVTEKDVFLRINKVRGIYKSVDDYLDIQFRLMREDFIHSLREGLMFHLNWHGKKKNIGIRIYKSVSILNSLPTDRDGIIHSLKFDISQLKNIKWKQSKRFLHGSLVCLSCDNFTSLLFATIVDRDPKRLSKGLISIKFERTFPDRNKIYTMIETTNLFESYKHVLVKLQETDEDNLPMKKYFVFAEENVSLPLYLDDDDELKYKIDEFYIQPGLENTDWPTATELNMDDSQFKAFKNSLRRELTIIQGPPGTGKTYLGLKICETLVKNVQKSVKNFGPILVVCYTNHALDQFLEGILKFSEKIVRIGARSKSEKLEKCLLRNLKHQTLFDTADKSSCYRELRKNKSHFFNLQAKIKVSEESLIKLAILKDFMIADHSEYFKRNDMKKWISGYTMKHFDSPYNVILREIVERNVNENIKHICNVRQLVEESLHEVYSEGINFNDDSDLDTNYINSERKIDAEDDIKEIQNELIREMRKLRKEICQSDDEEYSNTFDKLKKAKSRMQRKLFRVYLQKENAMTKEDVEKIFSVASLDMNDRWRLYHFWRSIYIESLNPEFQSIECRFQDVSKQLEEIRFDEDRIVMMNQDIIGMTTTGAARYGRVLAEIKCKIVIVEEAAEVLESHIIGSLNQGCEHLILIGDHKQLRPNPNVYELAKKYKLDLSLFERLINNKLHYDTLQLQHRMRPEIAEIMRFIYENLENDKSVLDYPNVPGVNTNLFFFDHQSPESANEEIISYSNRFEAEFIVAFCRRLMQNGINNSSITILTLYSGQMFEFRQLMNSDQFEGIRVCVVDNYQGEENDIILLSLVRSNEDEKIGFLNIDNRICVCLSRAKHGLYVFGNFELLASKNQLWSKICRSLTEKTLLDRKMTLICSMHPLKKLKVTNCKDFSKYPNGGCDQTCNFKLKCGHVCKTICHLDDHEKRKCYEKCGKSCTVGHACRLECWQLCGGCPVPLLKEVPGCNHKQLLPCHKKPESKDCKLKCERILPCGHKCSKLCGEECNLCLFQVIRKCPECRNKVKQNCHNEKVFCNRCCNQKLACGHKCSGSCETCNNGRLHIPCKQVCRTKLICGHEFASKCIEKRNFCREKCQEGCFHNCCTNNCGDSCIDCEDDCLWSCAHYKCTNRCYQFCNRPMCDARCNKSIKCRVCQKIFECYGVCGEMCWTFCGDCNIMLKKLKRNFVRKKTFVTLWTCGHTFECDEMDQHMNTPNPNEEISPKRCPKCQAVINNRSCLRYSNLMKIISLDIKRVQTLFIDESQFDQYPLFIDLYVENQFKLRELFSGFNVTDYVSENHISHKKMSNFDTRKCFICLDFLMHVHQWLLRNIENQGLVEYVYIKKSIVYLLKWLNPMERTFDSFELDQYYSECDRIHLLIELSHTYFRDVIPSEQSKIITELKSIVHFSGDIAVQFVDMVRNTLKTGFKLEMGLDLKLLTKREPYNGVIIRKDCWRKCRRGHFYFLNDSNNTVQCSKCALPLKAVILPIQL